MLAPLFGHGITYFHATTTRSSDSFPILVAQLTGGILRRNDWY